MATDLTPYRKVRIDRVEHMIEVFKKLPDKMINLGSYILVDRKVETLAEARQNECGTVACLAGHVVLEFAPRKWKVRQSSDSVVFNNGKRLRVGDEAARLLGLPSYDDAADMHLFCPSGCYTSEEGTDRGEAIRRLATLLDLAKKAQNK